jgi:hypothetical protein
VAIRVTSLLMTSRVSLPAPASYNLHPRESKIFPFVEYDKFINDWRIADYLRKKAINIEDLDAAGGTFVSQWNLEPKLRLGGWVYWVDVTGALRMKFGDPTFDLDGFIVGPGGAPVAHGPTHVFNGVDPVPDIEVLETAWTCPAGVQVRDGVYQTGASSVDQALADDISTMPVVGVVLSKPTPTSCIIARSGEVPGFTGLTADVYYYASASTVGAITSAPPSTSGDIVQQVGYAKTTTILVVELSRPLKKA